MHYPSMSNALPPLKSHTGNCVSLEFDLQDQYFASGGADAVVAVYDVHELICITTLDHLEWPVRRISFSHDGSLIAASSQDKDLSLVRFQWWRAGAEARVGC